MYTNFVTFKGGNKKKEKKKLIVTQSWYDSIERFFQFHTLLFLEMDANLAGLFLFSFETLHARIILTQIWSKSIKRSLRYCHFHVLRYF